MTRTSFRRVFTAAVALSAMTASAARADITVSTIPQWNGSTSISSFGTPQTTTYGETFTNTPNYASMTSFTFEIKNDTATPINFMAYIYQWTGSAITGPALFTSAPLVVLPNPPSTGFQGITVATGNTPLTAGGQYVAFFSTIGKPNAASTASEYGDVPSLGNSFFGGGFVYNNANSFADLAGGNPWNSNGVFPVLAFQMTFVGNAAVPEPSPIALAALASGVFAAPVALRRWRAKKSAA